MSKTGRPTKYKGRETCKIVDKYLENTHDEYTMIGGKERIQVNLPTVKGLALFIGVGERTLYDWRDKYKEFSQSLERVIQTQETMLINAGLSGEYNSTIAKLILSANHGYAEQKKQIQQKLGLSEEKKDMIDKVLIEIIKQDPIC